MKIYEALKEARESLARCDFVERSRLEAEILLAFILQQERVWLHTHENDTLDSATKARFFELVARRESGEPIEYIIKSVSFYSQNFYITKGALIPRPETEILVDIASEIITQNSIKSVAEVGIGSGAISCMLALKNEKISIKASDISCEALEIARKNISHFELGERICLFHGSLLEPLSGDFELLVSNPPYIANTALLPKPLAHEPRIALFGGECGSEILEALFLSAKERAIPYFVAEMGYDQEEVVSRFAERIGCKNLQFYRDLAGLMRGFIAEF